MANSNISYVQLVSTFNEWRATTNDLIEDRNILRNAHYVKDNGTFTILANVSNVNPLLTVGNSGNGNVIIGNVLNVVTVNANTFIGRGSGENLESLILTVYAKANAAANTVRVSQNNGSILSANQLNFVNTSTITITVSDSGNGNANISFVGSGGISNVAVLANGAGSVNANGLNFVNTSTVIVSTGASSTAGNANISFTVSGSGITLKSVNEFLHTNTNVDSANTVNLANANWFAMTLTGSSGNRQFTFTNAPAANVFSHNMIIIQDGSGGKTPTWANTIYWAGGQVPPATTTASARDIWTFTTYDGGTTYIGTLSVKNAS